MTLRVPLCFLVVQDAQVSMDCGIVRRKRQRRSIDVSRPIQFAGTNGRIAEIKKPGNRVRPAFGRDLGIVKGARYVAELGQCNAEIVKGVG